MCFSTSIGGLNRQIPLLLCVYFLTAEEYAVFANGCLQIPLIASVISSATVAVTPDIIENFNTHSQDVMTLSTKCLLKTSLHYFTNIFIPLCERRSNNRFYFYRCL